jgi:hypothetical protein
MSAYNGASVYPDFDKGEIVIRLYDKADLNIRGELRLGLDNARHLAGLINSICDLETAG